MAFLDVSKAYNTVWHEGLWRKMRQYGIGLRVQIEGDYSVWAGLERNEDQHRS